MNPITNPKDNKFIKIFKIIFLIAVAIGIITVILSYIFSRVFYNYKLFDLLFIPVELRTTVEHQKALGIETAKISGEEEKKIDSMINESIKAQLEYYSTEKDESLEKVKSLYLPEKFDQYKEYVKRNVATTKETQKYYNNTKLEFDVQRYDKIEQIKFSSPVTYKVLPGRIGIMNLVKFKGKYVNNLEQLFIFKNINGEWKIEKQREIDATPDVDENMLIQKMIKDGK